jgi:hypothetical protein
LRLVKRPYRLPSVEKTLTQDEFSWSACELDYDNDGKSDVFLTVNYDSPGGRLFHNLGSGRFVDVTESAGFSPMHTAHACSAGDFDNDGWTDLAVGGAYPARLFRNRGNGTFIALEEPAFPSDRWMVGELRFLDLDHDGDLDLYITGTPEEPDHAETLLRNNGNGTFTDVAEASGLFVQGSTYSTTSPPVFLFNPREGAFQQKLLSKESTPIKVWSLAVFDFNHDGWQDVAMGSADGVSIWNNVRGRQFEKIAVGIPADFRVTRLATGGRRHDKQRASGPRVPQPRRAI